MRVKYLSVKSPWCYHLVDCPNFHKSGSIKGMKKLFYGKNALLIQSGDYIYNVSALKNAKKIYYNIAK